MATNSICLDATLAAEAATDPGDRREHREVGEQWPRAVRNIEKQEREDIGTHLRRSPSHHWDLSKIQISRGFPWTAQLHYASSP